MTEASTDKNGELDFISMQVLSSDMDVWEHIKYLEHTPDYNIFKSFYEKNKSKKITKNQTDIINENNTILLLKKIIEYNDDEHYEFDFDMFPIYLEEKDESLNVCVYYKKLEEKQQIHIHLVSIENVNDEEYLNDGRVFIIYSILKKLQEFEEINETFLNRVLYALGPYDETNIVSLDTYLKEEEERRLEQNRIVEKMKQNILEKEEEERMRIVDELIAEEEKEKEEKQKNTKSPGKKQKRKTKKNTKVTESLKMTPKPLEMDTETSTSQPSDTLQTQLRPEEEIEEEEFWLKYLQVKEDEAVAQRLSRSPDTIDKESKKKVNKLLEEINPPNLETPDKEEVNELSELVENSSHMEIGTKIKKKKQPLPSFLPEYYDGKHTIEKLNFLASKNILDIETIPLEYEGQTFYFRVVKNSYIYEKIKNIKNKSILESVVNELFGLPEEEYKFLSIYEKTTRKV